MTHSPAENPFLETADIHTSSEEYAGRFSGPVGEWMLEIQERITLQMVERFGNPSILDVGGGHAQLAVPLCRRGYAVTVLGSDASCGTRLGRLQAGGNCTFIVGNVLALPFPDRHFDVVLCFRLLTHCERWPELVKELCRVARQAVIVDYPTSTSLNAVAPALFGVKKKMEKNTRTWTLFRPSRLNAVFEQNGFSCTEIRKQFFLPMVLHRMLKRQKLSAFGEGVCRALGLTRLWGSPVIAQMEPRSSRQT
ncbi:MAG: class I SAM-dependent methyltransferase [Verrucomicrobiota bacterium]|jgi:ubiquinone/menaquinone biosynthesis C-methylase UbiE|nr:class I SAM-dependent methyltransferase [Verrucomicrobiota bacterium]